MNQKAFIVEKQRQVIFITDRMEKALKFAESMGYQPYYEVHEEYFHLRNWEEGKDDMDVFAVPFNHQLI